MPLSRIHCVSLYGLDAVPVEVEVDVSDLPDLEKLTFVIVGLPDTAVRESKDRVLTAVKNSGFKIGCIHCTVSLAPGDLKKEGVLYDLPIAIGLLRSLGHLKASNIFEDYLIVGELGLGGQLRPVVGALAIAMLARDLGKKGILLPAINANEAAMVTGIKTYAIATLKEAVRFFENPTSFQPVVPQCDHTLFNNGIPLVDFCDIKGQAHVKRALEVAAAGAHNIVLCGPPGTGKTLMAKALVGIMPDLTLEEALEVTRVHSIAGLLPEGKSMVTRRPFRSPHHTVSYAGLVGGGTNPKPGEVSLAHQGILFLDELPEFSRSVLEVLRQPLEDRKVTISRANGSFTFPTNIMCVAAMNPCPCGYQGHPEKACKDTEIQIERYRSKISGPLWDRLDMHIEVPHFRYAEMLKEPPSESSQHIRKRVERARQIQNQRLGKTRTNSQLSPKELKQHCFLSPECVAILHTAIENMSLSARACDRIIRVSRTLADLAESPQILQEHILEAVNFRSPS